MEFSSNLIHDPKCFKRETLEKRMQLTGVKSLTRLELFLWDLEIFLQFQRILGDRLVLKGGAAVQFYLPVHEQRTSIDIDMLFYGDLQEIRDALSIIESKFPHDNGLFVFHQHQPKQPKTKLPLYTFFLQVPSVCTRKELRYSSESQQRIKIEFIICESKPPIASLQGNTIFAVDSQEHYQILPLENLLADKLTTLGPNTIGIQDERLDEQIKQIYDCYWLLVNHYQVLSADMIRRYYLLRAESEAESRCIDFNIKDILSDIMTQLKCLRNLDDGSEESKRLWQYILNFISLYASRSAIRTVTDWVIVGEKLRFMMSIIMERDGDMSKFIQAQSIERILRYDDLSGIEKGQHIASLRSKIIIEYGKLTGMDYKILKGKRLDRIFWAIADLSNLNEINEFIIQG